MRLFSMAQTSLDDTKKFILVTQTELLSREYEGSGFCCDEAHVLLNGHNGHRLSILPNCNMQKKRTYIQSMCNKEMIPVTISSGSSMYCRTAACKTGCLTPSGNQEVLGSEVGFLEDLISLALAWNKLGFSQS